MRRVITVLMLTAVVAVGNNQLHFWRTSIGVVIR